MSENAAVQAKLQLFPGKDDKDLQEHEHAVIQLIASLAEQHGINISAILSIAQALCAGAETICPIVTAL